MQQESTVKAYETKTIDSLLYNRKPAVIESIIERRQRRYLPRGARSGLTAGQQVEFEITHDMFNDLKTAYLGFSLASTDTDGKICNAGDIIDILEIFYNDVLVEKISNCGEWSNSFLAHSAHPEWFKREGRALLGISNQCVGGDATATGSIYLQYGDRALASNESYVVPIALSSGFFRSKYFLPIVGNKLRVVITLAPNKKVLSFRTTAATDAYTVNDLFLSMEDIVVQSQYRAKVLEAMQGEGFRIPFTSYQTNELSLAASTTQNLVLNANLSNAISLFMLHDPQVYTSNGAGTGKLTDNAGNNNLNVCWDQSFPLSGFGSLMVNCGSRQFGPSDGFKTYSELYTSTEQCINYLCDLKGSGYIDYATFKAGYTKAIAIQSTNPGVTAGTYGLCLLGVNLEKSVENDDATINNGISSQDGFSQFEIKLTTSDSLASSSKLLTNIVHKRALVFQQSGISCEF